MFYDRAKVYLKAGDGGNGLVSFRREKFVPEGGPNGGDGGRGGSVYLVADHNLRTLLDFKMKQHYKAPKGENGQNSNKVGKSGKNIYLKVPLGTVVRFDGEEAIIADLVEDGQSVCVAKGGRGGRGNARFASNRDKAPEVAEKGEPGEEVWVRLELKVLADVGLVGMPNAGKSTFISRVSSARPKIADYPFTTLEPNLGIVNLGDERTFCIADVPGLIENAHEGAGLGHHFLRHLERTKVLVHLIDMSGQEGRDPLEDFEIISNELKKYKDELWNKPRIICANKMDLPDSEENLERLQKKYGNDFEIYPIAAAAGGKEDLQKVLLRCYELILAAPKVEEKKEEEIKVTTFKERCPFTIHRDDHGYFIVEGSEVKKWIAMTDFGNDASVQRLQRIFKAMGLDDGLRKAGAHHGDTVIAYDLEFDFAE